MLQALVSTAHRMLDDLLRSWQGDPSSLLEPAEPTEPAPKKYLPLRRVVLTDGVGHTLFEEFAAHRASARGEEETGWLLLGVRETDEALILATLPAGTERDAGIGHVQFNSRGQVLGSRIVRQQNRRLTTLGVVHTHPGSLRHPSDGDYRGDSLWVGQLRGGEGVFGIGTADGLAGPEAMVARQPRPNVQCLGPLTFAWYALRRGDRHYRPLPVDLTLGPDLARPLHDVWLEVETFADQFNRLFRQQAGMRFEVVAGIQGPALAAQLPLAEPGTALRVLVEGHQVRYYLERNGDTFEADPKENRVDRGVYLLLAELAAQAD